MTTLPEGLHGALQEAESAARALQGAIPMANSLSIEHREPLELAARTTLHLHKLDADDFLDTVDGIFALIVPPESEEDEDGPARGEARVSHQAFILQNRLRRLRSAGRQLLLPRSNSGSIEPDIVLREREVVAEAASRELSKMRESVELLSRRVAAIGPQIASGNTAQLGLVNLAGGIELKIDIVEGLIKATLVAVNVASGLLRSVGSSAKKLINFARQHRQVDVEDSAAQIERSAAAVDEIMETLVEPLPRERSASPPLITSPDLAAIVDALIKAAQSKRTIQYKSLVSSVSNSTGAGFAPRMIGTKLNPIADILLELSITSGVEIPVLTAIAVSRMGKPGAGLERNIISHAQCWKGQQGAIADQERWQSPTQHDQLVLDYQNAVFDYDGWASVRRKLIGEVEFGQPELPL
jgi:hypothetical protein